MNDQVATTTVTVAPSATPPNPDRLSGVLIASKARWAAIAFGILQSFLSTMPKPIGAPMSLLAVSVLPILYNVPATRATRLKSNRALTLLAAVCVAGDFGVCACWTLLAANDVAGTQFATFVFVAIECALFFGWRGVFALCPAYALAMIGYYWLRATSFGFAFGAASFLYRVMLIVLIAAMMGAIMSKSTRSRVSEVRARREAEIARKQAEAASHEKNSFLSRVSHELRTPLTAIIGFADLVTVTDDSDLKKEFNDSIIQASDHLLVLINDILDVSRIEEGNLSLSIEQVSVGEVIHDVRHITEPQARAAGVTVDLEETPGLHVFGDRSRVRQVVLNLLTNAIKFNHRGGSVTLTLKPAPDGTVRIDVADTGIGMSEAQMARMFTPFDRLGAENLNITGTGLGLVITKLLVEAMDGSMEITSREGEGSVFSVRLPEAAAPEPVDGMSDAEESGDVREYAAQKRLLYIEDVPANVEVVARMLERRPSIRLLAAESGRNGLRAAEQDPPDLILLDLHLPDMSGEEVLAELRGHSATAGIPVVMLSADALTPTVERVLDLNVSDYITKPMKMSRLLSVVDSLLDVPTAVDD